MSGITLVFVPPWMTVGANVVWVQAWNWRAMPSGSSSQQRRRARRVEQQRSASSSAVAHALDEPAPHVVDLRLGLVLVEAAHDLGRLHQRVVGAVAAATRGPGVPVTRSVHQ